MTIAANDAFLSQEKEKVHHRVDGGVERPGIPAVSYTHLRAHETVLDLVCRLLLEKKKRMTMQTLSMFNQDT